MLISFSISTRFDVLFESLNLIYTDVDKFVKEKIRKLLGIYSIVNSESSKSSFSVVGLSKSAKSVIFSVSFLT
jgi:hypothetical protein